jgi:L-arabinonolactonase
LAVLERDSLLLATDVGLVSFSLSSGAWQVLCDIEPDRPGNRTNDGKMDPFGRFWFGTMDDAEKASSGALYSFDAERRLRKHLDGVAISNTLAWDLERGLFYFADSARQSIYVFDYDEEEGSIANRRLFVSTVDDGVYPDGSAIDKEGYLWNCQWDGWRVVRYAPDGTIARSVPMPVQRPTSCAFGEDGTILYVTTARVGLSESDLAEQPLAGSVLRVVV